MSTIMVAERAGMMELLLRENVWKCLHTVWAGTGRLGHVWQAMFPTECDTNPRNGGCWPELVESHNAATSLRGSTAIE
jgi:hypothetical protein